MKIPPRRFSAPPVELIKAMSELGITSVLDIGCGDGWLYYYLPKEIFYVGFDHNSAIIKANQKRHPEATFIDASIQNVATKPNLILGDRKFDCAFLKCILCIGGAHPSLDDIIEIIKKKMVKYVALCETIRFESHSKYWPLSFRKLGRLIFEKKRNNERMEIWDIRNKI